MTAVVARLHAPWPLLQLQLLLLLPLPLSLPLLGAQGLRLVPEVVREPERTLVLHGAAAAAAAPAEEARWSPAEEMAALRAAIDADQQRLVEEEAARSAPAPLLRRARFRPKRHAPAPAPPPDPENVMRVERFPDNGEGDQRARVTIAKSTPRTTTEEGDPADEDTVDEGDSVKKAMPRDASRDYQSTSSRLHSTPRHTSIPQRHLQMLLSMKEDLVRERLRNEQGARASTGSHRRSADTTRRATASPAQDVPTARKGSALRDTPERDLAKQTTITVRRRHESNRRKIPGGDPEAEFRMKGVSGTEIYTPRSQFVTHQSGDDTEENEEVEERESKSTNTVSTTIDEIASRHKSSGNSERARGVKLPFAPRKVHDSESAILYALSGLRFGQFVANKAEKAGDSADAQIAKDTRNSHAGDGDSLSSVEALHQRQNIANAEENPGGIIVSQIAERNDDGGRGFVQWNANPTHEQPSHNVRDPADGDSPSVAPSSGESLACVTVQELGMVTFPQPLDLNKNEDPDVALTPVDTDNRSPKTQVMPLLPHDAREETSGHILKTSHENEDNDKSIVLGYVTLEPMQSIDDTENEGRPEMATSKGSDEVIVLPLVLEKAKEETGDRQIHTTTKSDNGRFLVSQYHLSSQHISNNDRTRGDSVVNAATKDENGNKLPAQWIENPEHQVSKYGVEDTNDSEVSKSSIGKNVDGTSQLRMPCMWQFQSRDAANKCDGTAQHAVTENDGSITNLVLDSLPIACQQTRNNEENHLNHDTQPMVSNNDNNNRVKVSETVICLSSKCNDDVRNNRHGALHVTSEREGDANAFTTHVPTYSREVAEEGIRDSSLSPPSMNKDSGGCCQQWDAISDQRHGEYNENEHDHEQLRASVNKESGATSSPSHVGFSVNPHHSDYVAKDMNDQFSSQVGCKHRCENKPFESPAVASHQQSYSEKNMERNDIREPEEDKLDNDYQITERHIWLIMQPREHSEIARDKEVVGESKVRGNEERMHSSALNKVHGGNLVGMILSKMQQHLKTGYSGDLVGNTRDHVATKFKKSEADFDSLGNQLFNGNIMKNKDVSSEVTTGNRENLRPQVAYKMYQRPRYESVEDSELAHALTKVKNRQGDVRSLKSFNQNVMMDATESRSDAGLQMKTRGYFDMEFATRTTNALTSDEHSAKFAENLMAQAVFASKEKKPDLSVVESNEQIGYTENTDSDETPYGVANLHYKCKDATDGNKRVISVTVFPENSSALPLTSTSSTKEQEVATRHFGCPNTSSTEISGMKDLDSETIKSSQINVSSSSEISTSSVSTSLGSTTISIETSNILRYSITEGTTHTSNTGIPVTEEQNMSRSSNGTHPKNCASAIYSRTTPVPNYIESADEISEKSSTETSNPKTHNNNDDFNNNCSKRPLNTTHKLILQACYRGSKQADTRRGPMKNSIPQRDSYPKQQTSGSYSGKQIAHCDKMSSRPQGDALRFQNPMSSTQSVNTTKCNNSNSEHILHTSDQKSDNRKGHVAPCHVTVLLEVPKKTHSNKVPEGRVPEENSDSKLVRPQGEEVHYQMPGAHRILVEPKGMRRKFQVNDVTTRHHQSQDAALAMNPEDVLDPPIYETHHVSHRPRRYISEASALDNTEAMGGPCAMLSGPESMQRLLDAESTREKPKQQQHEDEDMENTPLPHPSNAPHQSKNDTVPPSQPPKPKRRSVSGLRVSAVYNGSTGERLAARCPSASFSNTGENGANAEPALAQSHVPLTGNYAANISS